MRDRIRDVCCKHNNYYKEDNYYRGVLNDGSTFKVDIEDLEIAQKYYWIKDVNGYIVTTTTRKRKNAYRLHRLIMNAPDELVVDHINHDRSDNRKQNLRLCTLSQNAMNTRDDPKRSLPNGICIDKKTGFYVAQITKNYKNIRLGRYKNLSDAVAARKKAEIELFGEFNYNKEQDCSIKTG